MSIGVLPTTVKNTTIGSDTQPGIFTVISGTDVRMIAGYYPGDPGDAYLGIKISDSGYDARTASQANLLFDSNARTDWKEVTASDYYVGSSGYFIYNNPNNTKDPHTIFQIGDKIRIKQVTGAYKYFYITSMPATDHFYLVQTTDYTLTSSEVITEFAYSRLPQPSGHPLVLSYTPTITANGSMTVSGVSGSAKFFMTGNAMFIFGSLSMTLGGTASNTITIADPIPYAATVVNGGVLVNRASDSGASNFTTYCTSTTGAFGKTSGSNWALGSATIDANYYFTIIGNYL